MAAFIAAIFMPRKFDPQKHFAEAAKYTSRSEFSRKSASSYVMLHRKGLLDQACAHMPISPVYVAPKWTHQSVFNEAAKYRTRAEFKRSCSGAHGYALDHGILSQSCSHMRDGHRFWHVFELMAVAIKYRHKSDFIQDEQSAYNFGLKNGLIPVICAHMDAHSRTWDRDAVMAAARECPSRGSFQSLYAGAYKHADKRGYLDDACAHMAPPEYGFQKEKSAVMYCLRISVGGDVFFKIGITNRDPLARVAGMGFDADVAVEVVASIPFESGRDAIISERRLHRKFSSYRYKGAVFMKNGTTEIFTVNPLDS